MQTMSGPIMPDAAECVPIRVLDPGYPACLERLPPGERPDRLFLSGRLPPLPGVGIVGTRSPDGHGMTLAARMGRECARRGLTVVSGGAVGIDSAAHRGCLDGGGRTVVVLAGGLDRPHPPSSRGLFSAAVASGGGLVSEQPPAVPVRRFLFLRRNRIIAALSGCLVVVQAGVRSGALSTASWARRCHVPVYAVAGSPLNPVYGGTNLLVAKGQGRILLSLDDPLENPAFQAVPVADAGGRKENRKPRDPIEKDEKAVMDLLGQEPMSVDDIAARTGRDAKNIFRLLFELEMKGLACAADPGRYRATARGLALRGSRSLDEKNG
jgi:DNA processing protein